MCDCASLALDRGVDVVGAGWGVGWLWLAGLGEVLGGGWDFERGGVEVEFGGRELGQVTLSTGGKEPDPSGRGADECR